MMLKELDKQDEKVNQSMHLNSSSSSNHDTSTILSNNDNDDQYACT